MEIVGIGSSGLKRCGGAGEDELVGIELEIDDLLDFSNEEIGGPINGMGIGIGIGICGSANSSAEAVSSEEYPGLSGGLSLWDSAQPSNLSLPCDETAELEWLSNFVHESFSPAPPLLLAPNNGTLLRNSKSDAPVSLLLNPKSDGDCDEARQVDEMKGRELGHAFFNPRSGGDDEARHGIKGRESSSSSSSSSNSRVESGSPVSVLENNGSSSYCSTSDGDGHGHSKANTNKRSLLIVPGRPRSKRPRKRAGKWMSSRIHLARGDIEDDSNSIPLLDCSSTSVMAADSAFLLHPLHQHQSQISGPNPFNYHHSPPKTQENKLQKPPALVVKKVKPKPKLLPLPLPSPLPIQKAKSASGDEDMQSRKCLHCGSQKTPQWRAGPLGPKTLCNACGVRFKSGRLFPEYRPAASPSFVEAVHSNSHRKVLEMRRLKESFDPAPPSASAAAAVSFGHPPLLHNNDHDDDDNSDDDDHGRHYITSFS